jgi:hypothetical protein
MGQLTDNIENKLTKHNTENSNNVQHELVSEFTHGFKQWVFMLYIIWGFCVVFS